MNAAGAPLTIQPGGWATIYGSNLANSTRSWQNSDFAGLLLPTVLDGVSVSIGGKRAYVAYISPNQLNVLLPPEVRTGAVEVVVTNNGASGSAMATAEDHAPALFRFGSAGGRYAASRVTLNDGTSLLAASDQVFGRRNDVAISHRGQIVSLYGTGFGPTAAALPGGVQFTGAYGLAATPSVTIGGQPAQVLFAGRVAPGMDQVNVVVPNLIDGDYPVRVNIDGTLSQADVFLSIGDTVNLGGPGIYNPLARASNTTIVLGDSISNATQDIFGQVWISQVSLRSSAKVLKIGDAGVPGDTTTQMLARIQSVVADHPAHCVILGGTNDISTLKPAQTVANIAEIVRILQDNQIGPIVATIPPKENWNANVTALNQTIRDFALKSNLPMVDFYSVLVDNSTGDYRPGFSVDGVHPTPVAAQLMADTFLLQAGREFMPVPSYLPTNDRNTNNLLSDPQFLKDSNQDGQQDDWSLVSGTGTSRLVPDGSGGNWQSITSTGTTYQLTRPYLPAGPQTYLPGDQLVLTARVRLDASASTDGFGQISIQFLDGTNDGIAPLIAKNVALTDISIYHEFVVPPATGFINLGLSAFGVGTNLQITQVGLFNLTKLAK